MKKLSLRVAFLVLASVIAVDQLGYAQVAPPTISKAFGASQIPLNGTTSLTFTITNPNAGTALTGIAATDILPSGLILPTPNGLSGNCSIGATLDSPTNTITLSGGPLAANTSCRVTVALIEGTTAGTKTNMSGNVTSTNGGTGNTASASITVGVAPPTISKAFGASQIPLNGTTSLTFTITNPNAGTALTGIAATDILPSGLILPTPNGLSGNCSIGATLDSPTNTITLSGGPLAANTSCRVTVALIEGTTAGTKTNMSGNVTSTNGGTGNTASASIDVLGPTNTPTNTPTNSPTNTPTNTPAPTPVPVVPMLDERGMLIFGLLVAGAGLLLLVRRR